MTRKLLSFLLVLSVLLTAMIGCADKTTPDDNTDEGAVSENTADSVSAEEETTAYIDAMKTVDYDGRAYNIASSDFLISYMMSEDLNGETINDAEYDQVHYTQDKYNVTIGFVAGDNNVISNSIQADDGAYQVVMAGVSSFASSFVTKGLMMNMYNIGELDFSQPWWNQNTVEELTFNNRLYLATGDFAAENGITFIHNFYFNKDLCRELGIDPAEIYQSVYDGKWTVEYLKNVIKDTNNDLNGDSIMDFADRYGLMQSIPEAGVYRTAFNMPIMTRDAEGWYEPTINNQLFQDMVDYIFEFCFSNPDVYTCQHNDENTIRDCFINGKTVFLSGFLMNNNELRSMEYEFGLLPFPKWEESQEEYRTTVRSDNYFLGVPVSTKEADYEFVGLVTQALGYYGYTLVRPAVYDDTLQGKLLRDEDSINMLNILTDGIIIEFAFAHSSQRSYSNILWTMLGAGMQNVDRYCTALTKSAAKYYDELHAIYLDLK